MLSTGSPGTECTVNRAGVDIPSEVRDLALTLSSWRSVWEGLIQVKG